MYHICELGRFWECDLMKDEIVSGSCSCEKTERVLSWLEREEIQVAVELDGTGIHFFYFVKR